MTGIRKPGWETGHAGADFAIQAVKTVAAKLAAGDLNGIGDAIDGQKQRLLASIDSLRGALGQAASAQSRLVSNGPRLQPDAVIEIADYRRHIAESQVSD